MAYRDEHAALRQRLQELEARAELLRRSRATLARELEGEGELLRELHALRSELAPSNAELRRRLPLLPPLALASPCEEPWDAMRGDDKKRFCERCSLHVHNLTAMSSGEVSALLEGTQGRLCVRFFRRADGTVLTQDCPVGLRRARRRRLRSAAVLGLGGAALAATVYAALAYLRPAREEPLSVDTLSELRSYHTLGQLERAPEEPARRVLQGVVRRRPDPPGARAPDSLLRAPEEGLRARPSPRRARR